MKSIYKPMKIQALIVAVIASFILYGCEDNEANCLELSESSFSNVDGDGATLTGFRNKRCEVANIQNGTMVQRHSRQRLRKSDIDPANRSQPRQ